MAELNFYFPHQPDWNQCVVVYFSDRWDGEPQESEEMAPKWFNKNKLPYKNMWPGDIYWLPLVLDGKMIKADFLFGEGDVILDSRIIQI